MQAPDMAGGQPHDPLSRKLGPRFRSRPCGTRRIPVRCLCHLRGNVGIPAGSRRRRLHRNHGHIRRRPSGTRCARSTDSLCTSTRCARNKALTDQLSPTRTEARSRHDHRGHPVVLPSPMPISWQEFITAGRATLISPPPAAQSAAAIRRASTACYAAFHALAAGNAEVLIGLAHDHLTAGAWVRIYRGLNHRHAKSQLKQNRASLSADAQVFVDLFCDLQNERHNADCNPRAVFTVRTATTWLNNTEAAIIDFLQASRSERTAVAVLTLVGTR